MEFQVYIFAVKYGFLYSIIYTSFLYCSFIVSRVIKANNRYFKNPYNMDIKITDIFMLILKRFIFIRKKPKNLKI